MADDPYVLLGVTCDASREEVIEAYRALAQIYHPDRYAEASPRVQQEAKTRMQALNAAFEVARGAARSSGARPAGARGAAPGGAGKSPRTGAPQAASTPPPWKQPPTRAQPPTVVHCVDGAKGYHNASVAPLGVASEGGTGTPEAPRCSKLDTELGTWFDHQRRNANLASRQLYESWSKDEQASYAAKVGSMQTERERSTPSQPRVRSAAPDSARLSIA